MRIAIEGIDGAGKHTQTQRLKARLEAAGLSVATLSFPRYGQTLMAQSVAHYLNGGYGTLDTLPPQFPALLFAGDRLESRPLIDQLATEHDVLLLDRYVASNLAHGAAKLPPAERGAFMDWLLAVEHDLYALPYPDVTLYLDVPVTVSATLVARKDPRTYTAAKADLHERDTAYLAACRDAYTLLAQRGDYHPWHTIACLDDTHTLRSIEAIHTELWTALSTTLQIP